jgi:hypothetical protein
MILIILKLHTHSRTSNEAHMKFIIGKRCGLSCADGSGHGQAREQSRPKGRQTHALRDGREFLGRSLGHSWERSRVPEMRREALVAGRSCSLRFTFA